MGRFGRITATLAFATALTVGQAGATARGPALVIESPGTYHLGRDAGAEPLRIILDLADLRAPAHDVTFTLDAGALAGKAELTEQPDSGCERLRHVFTCAYGTVNGPVAVRPFAIRRAPGAAPGASGALEAIVTSSDAPAVTRSLRVVVGGPELIPRRHPMLDAVPPGATVSLTPAFANEGELAAGEGVGLLLYGQEGLETAARHGNCRYSAAYGGSAWCVFPGPVVPGLAYETDAPITYTVGDRLMYGLAGYLVWPLDGPSPYGFDPAAYPEAGTGPALGLRPAARGGFDPAGGHLDVRTTQHADFQAVGGTVRAKPGGTAAVTLGVRNAGPGAMDLADRDDWGTAAYEVTPPEGTTVTGITRPGDEETRWACAPARAGAPVYTCVIDGPMNVGDASELVFRFRVDRRPAGGAPGRVVVVPRADYPTRDRVPDNDVASVGVGRTRRALGG